MEKIIEDALTVQSYLPWVENDEDIINFMRKIPLDNSYLRIPIAIKFFLNHKDNTPILEQQIEDDAKDIVTILPNFPFQQVKKQLKLLGNISNRKEVALRILLNEREDLQVILDHMSHDLDNRKRCISEKNNESNQDVISKIRKVDGNHSESLNTDSLSKEANMLAQPQRPHRIIQPARFLIPNNAITKDLQIRQPVPAMAEQVPEVFQVNQAIPETTIEPYGLQPALNELPEIVVSSAFSLEEIPALPQQFLKNYPERNFVNDEVAFPVPVDLSTAGPSKPNITNGIVIDLDDIEQIPDVLPSKKKRNCDEKLVFRLIEMFPETCPDYIRDICDNKEWSDFDELVSVIIDNENHPKRQRSASPVKEVDPEEQFEIVKALLPDADLTYLRMKCEMLEYKPDELNKFIIQAREKKDYPTMKEYLRNQQLSAQSKQYTTEFNLENFVQLFPEPHITFNDPKRVIELDNYSRLYLTQYFLNKFDRLPKKVIVNILLEKNYKILETNSQLSLIQNSSLKMKTRRKQTSLDNNIKNILVLQEIAYMEHKDEIENHLKSKQEKENIECQYAKDNGLMNTCQCCFDDEVMPKNTFYCPKECLFCRSCIKKSCEIKFGEGRTDFKCLNECPEEFSLQTLQNILTPKMFSKIAQKKMIEEIKAAGIEDLEMCPFCDFASIPNEQDKIFKCLNPDCMKESCRNCKEPNHIPLHCDEIEKDENVKARVFLENQMTEALLCKCWKCGTSFFKEEGCNKMTCTCGAQMCYVCKKPVTDYTHFNGMGGDKHHLCPLYSDNNNLNQQKVLKAVKEAKAQIDESKLKVDPSDNLKQFYEAHASRLPREAHLDLLINLNRHALFQRRRNRNHHH